MIANAAIINIVLFGWLWPFGEARVDVPEVATIQSLENRVVELPEVLRTEADDRAALAQYRLYLRLPDGDPGMRMEAMRRLGDLSLTVVKTRTWSTRTILTACGFILMLFGSMKNY